MSGETSYETLTLAAPIGADTKRVRILPIGDVFFRGYDVTVSVTDDDAEKIIQTTLAKWGAQDGPIDYDHQLEYNVGEGKGGQAPASGWVKSLFLVKGDGIYGDVEWTPLAAQKIKDKEYKYFSPTVMRGAKSGKIYWIKNAGLVNEPSIDGLTKLAAALKTKPQEENMDLTKIAAALGLAAAATLEQVTKAVEDLKAKSDASEKSLSTITAALGVQDADVEKITASINGLKAKKDVKEDEIIVTASLFNGLQETVTKLTASANEAKIDAAIKEGKITPAQKEEYLKLMASQPEVAERLIASAPKIIGDGVQVKEPKKDDLGLTEDQIKLCASMGVSKEEFLAAQKSRLENEGDE